MPWILTSASEDWEIFPHDDLALIRAKVAELAAQGYTTDDLIPFVDAPDGTQHRDREFTTLESAEEFANFLNTFPPSVTKVISIVEKT